MLVDLVWEREGREKIYLLKDNADIQREFIQILSVDLHQNHENDEKIGKIYHKLTEGFFLFSSGLKLKIPIVPVLFRSGCSTDQNQSELEMLKSRPIEFQLPVGLRKVRKLSQSLFASGSTNSIVA